jgi:hypothetical protein
MLESPLNSDKPAPEVRFALNVLHSTHIFSVVDFEKFHNFPILKVVHQSEKIKTIIKKTSAYAASFETKWAFFRLAFEFFQSG